MRLSHVLNLQTLRNVYFVHFHSLVNYGIIFWGNTSSMHKAFLNPPPKKIYCEMPGISSKSSCRKKFKKLDILPIPRLHIFPLILFVVDNLH